MHKVECSGIGARIVLGSLMAKLNKLAKLLELTASPFDGEALNATRMANSEILKHDMTWTEFVNNKTIIVINEEVRHGEQNYNAQDEIKNMLSICLQRCTSESGMEFIESLNKQYTRRGTLSDKQLSALRRWYENM